MALPNYPMMSVEDYLILDRGSKETRYEYLDGVLSMLAGGSTYHSMITANLTGILYGLLSDSPCRVYSPDIRLQLSESRYVYADVTVSCDQHDQELDDMISHPRVVIEVLSPSTEATDRGKKFLYYRECQTVQEYLMVDSQSILIEVYRREEESWKLHTFGPGNTQEERLQTVEYNLQQFKTETLKAYGELAMELIIIKGLTEDTVKRLVTMRQDFSELKTTLGEHTRVLGEHTRILDEHTRVLNEHTARFDHLETLLTQILTRLPEKP